MHELWFFLIFIMENFDSEQAADERIKNFFSTQNSLSNIPSHVDVEAAHNAVASHIQRDQEDHTRKVPAGSLCFLPADGRQIFAGFTITLDDTKLNSLHVSVDISLDTKRASLLLLK